MAPPCNSLCAGEVLVPALFDGLAQTRPQLDPQVQSPNPCLCDNRGFGCYSAALQARTSPCTPVRKVRISPIGGSTKSLAGRWALSAVCWLPCITKPNTHAMEHQHAGVDARSAKCKL
eukprot:555068-Amphidinium_carterae.3